MSIMYGSRYVAKIYDYKSGATITDYLNNKEILINELELLALNGKMHIIAVQNGGRPLSDDEVDEAVNYILTLRQN